MKKKRTIIKFLLSFTVLLTMLFQTIHTVQHVFEAFSHQDCVHKSDGKNPQITHSHEQHHDCPACHFTFSSFIPASVIQIAFAKEVVATQKGTFYECVLSTLYNKRYFSLRAPPIRF